MSCAKTNWRSWLVPAVFGAVLTIAFPAFADEFRSGDITVSDPFARASAGPAKAGAAYLTISNSGTQVDRLMEAKTTVAKTAQVHATLLDNGVMKMRPVKAVEVSPGEPTVLRPGELHIMLMGLQARLVEGQTFALTLTFEIAGTIEVDVPVLGAGAKEVRHKHGDGKNDMKAM